MGTYRQMDALFRKLDYRQAPAERDRDRLRRWLRRKWGPPAADHFLRNVLRGDAAAALRALVAEQEDLDAQMREALARDEDPRGPRP